MKRLLNLVLFLPFVVVSQAPQVHHNVIDLGAYSKAYSHGDVHLVEDIDFTNAGFNIDNLSSIYERQIYYTQHPVNYDFDLDGVPGNEGPTSVEENYRQRIFEENPVGFVNLLVPQFNYIDNTGLHLETKKINDNTYAFHSLSSAYPYRYGIYELTAKLIEGDGLLSSWFFYGDRSPFGPQYGNCADGGIPLPAKEYNKNWQEIDVWEMNGEDIYIDDLRSDLHFTDLGLQGTGDWCNTNDDPLCEKCNNGYLAKNTDKNFFDEFHTYTLYWDPHYIITFVDGYVYRYWIQNEPLNKKNGSPDPVNFIDAMYMYLEAKIFDNPYDDSALHGIDANNPPPSNELTVQSFKHWVFTPCFQSSSDPVPPVFNKLVDANVINSGLFETGDIVEISHTRIEPYTFNGVPVNWDYGEKMNLIASKRITIKPNFHASGSEINRNYHQLPEIFTAKIKPCGSSNNSVEPYILNMGSGGTYLERLWGNMPTKINESYKNSGPWKLAESGSINEKIVNIKIDRSNIEVEIKSQLNEVCIYSLDGRLIAKFSDLEKGKNYLNKNHTFSSGMYILIINNQISQKVWVQ